MEFDTAYMITALVTMFVVIDPIAIAPVFLALTRGMSNAERRKIAWRAVSVAAVVLLIFAAFGEAVLGFIGISMPAFRIAGGILLFLTALDMLFERRTKRREDQAEEAEEDYPDPSIFPLAIPLLSGPGAITSVILLAGQDTGIQTTLSVLAVAALVLAIVFTLFLTASALERLLGRTGITVITRLLGMLLAALAVQFILDGLTNFGFAG